MKLKHLLSVIITLCALSVPVSPLFSQASRFDSILLSGVPRPIAGANVSVCQAIATTAASVTNNLATYTMASNPITAGYAAGGQLLVAGFTGGDTFFNVGVYNSTSNSVTSGAVVLSVSTTGITVALSHANASAGSNGTILQMGNSTTSCAGRSTLYTDTSAGTTSSNPVVTDGRGNFGWWAVAGQYYYQVYGPGITTYLHPASISGTGAVQSVSGSTPIVVSPTVGATVVSCPTCFTNSNSSDTQIIFNAMGVATGSQDLFWNSSTNTFSIKDTSHNLAWSIRASAGNTCMLFAAGTPHMCALTDLEIAAGSGEDTSIGPSNALTDFYIAGGGGALPLGMFRFGGGSAVGVLCPNDGTTVGFTGGCWYSGHGTPQGVVVANIGSIYTRTDGGSSTTFYVKESNSGMNTGWVAK